MQLICVFVFQYSKSRFSHENCYNAWCCPLLTFTVGKTVTSSVNENNIHSKKSSAQVGVRVNYVLTRNDCIKCYISLFI